MILEDMMFEEVTIPIGVENPKRSGGVGGGGGRQPPPMMFEDVTIQRGYKDSRKGVVEYKKAVGGLAGVASPMMLQEVQTYRHTLT